MALRGPRTPAVVEGEAVTIPEVQKALDAMVDSIDVEKLAKVLDRQMGIPCSICGKRSKNLRGNSRHLQVHRR